MWPEMPKVQCAVEVQMEEMNNMPSFSQTFPLHPTEMSLHKRCFREDSDGDSGTDICHPSSASPSKKFKPDKTIQESVSVREIDRFLKICESTTVFDFLAADGCRHVADNYLIAMVFAYFKRADFKPREFTKMNFFIGLYLASDMEEDEEEFKYEIFPWALGKNWRDRYMAFLRKRDQLWARMDFRAAVSAKCCEEIMQVRPDHWVWQRARPARHAGAIRPPREDEVDEDDAYPRGPARTPRICPPCAVDQRQYDSTSPDNWFSSSSDSSPEIFLSATGRQGSCRSVRCNLERIQSRFDMQGLQKTLQEDDIWAHAE